MSVADVGRWLISLMTAGLMAGCSAVSAPVTEPQVAGFAMRLSNDISLQTEQVHGPITVEQAVSRALRLNPTVRARELEHALAEAKVRAQSMAMLPSLVGELDYYKRDRPLLSHSNQSATYSTSSDTRTVSRDITLSWNILDFGLALVRARQGLDKARQQELEADRIAARIVEETRTVYWRAVALQYLEPELKRIGTDIKRALALAKRASSDPEIDPTLAITLQRDILNLQRELNQLHTSLAGAKDQLAQLIAAPPGSDLPLNPRQPHQALLIPATLADQDIREAMIQRPEIRQHLYDLRITEQEIDAAVLEVLPGVTFSKSFSSDTNSFLYHSNWISWGTRIAGNLVNLARLPAELAVIDKQHAVNRQMAVATATTIAMQVHMSRARLGIQAKANQDARHFAAMQRDLVEQTRAAVKTGRAGEQALTREQLALVLAQTREILAFADFHAAHAAYQSALGNVHRGASDEIQFRTTFIVDQ